MRFRLWALTDAILPGCRLVDPVVAAGYSAQRIVTTDGEISHLVIGAVGVLVLKVAAVPLFAWLTTPIIATASAARLRLCGVPGAGLAFMQSDG